MALLTCTWSLGFQYRWRRGAEAANSLLLITTLSLGEKLIKVGNHHSKDYLCHRSWNNNRHKSSEVKTETSFGFYLSEKGTSSGLCFPPGFFWAAGVLVLLVGGDSLGRGKVRGEGQSKRKVCYCNRAYEGVKRRAVCRSHARATWLTGEVWTWASQAPPNPGTPHLTSSASVISTTVSLY